MRLPYALTIIMATCLAQPGCTGDYRQPLYSQDKEPPGTGESVNGSREGVWTQQASNGEVV